VRHTENLTKELNAEGAVASQRGVKARPGHSFKAAEIRCDAPCDAGALRRTAYIRLDVYIVAPPRLGLRHSGLYVELSRNVKRGATQRCDARRDAPCDIPPVTQKTHPVKNFHVAAMACRELLQLFVATVEQGEPDWALLRKLMHKCSSFSVEALKALAKKAANCPTAWPGPDTADRRRCYD
jgi:hypothetical protein